MAMLDPAALRRRGDQLAAENRNMADEIKKLEAAIGGTALVTAFAATAHACCYGTRLSAQHTTAWLPAVGS